MVCEVEKAVGAAGGGEGGGEVGEGEDGEVGGGGSRGAGDRGIASGIRGGHGWGSYMVGMEVESWR